MQNLSVDELVWTKRHFVSVHTSFQHHVVCLLLVVFVGTYAVLKFQLIVRVYVCPKLYQCFPYEGMSHSQFVVVDAV